MKQSKFWSRSSLAKSRNQHLNPYLSDHTTMILFSIPLHRLARLGSVCSFSKTETDACISCVCPRLTLVWMLFLLAARICVYQEVHPDRVFLILVFNKASVSQESGSGREVRLRLEESGASLHLQKPCSFFLTSSEYIFWLCFLRKKTWRNSQ